MYDFMHDVMLFAFESHLYEIDEQVIHGPKHPCEPTG